MPTVSPLYFNTTTGFNQQINTVDDLVALYSLQLAGNLQLTALSTGVAKVDASGNFSSSLVVNADVNAAAAIAGTKISPDFGAQNVATTGTLNAGASTLDSAVITNALSAGASTLASAVVSGTLNAGASTLDSAVITNALSAGASTLASAVVSGTLSAGASTLASAVVSNTLSAGASTFASVVVSNLTSVPGLVHNDASGNLMTSALVNADVSASAAIDGTKIAPNFGAQNVITTGSITSGAGAVGVAFADITNSSFKLSDAASVQQFLASSDGSLLLGTGSAQIALNAASSGKISNLTDPTLAQDAATKAYVDAVAQGLSVKNSSVYGYSANQTLSGLPSGLIEADQVLLTGQTNAVDNGLWLVHVGAWTRPANFANGQNAAGAFTFIGQNTPTSGGLPQATGWVCTTPEASAIIGTNALTFTQFSAAGQYTAAAGIVIDGATIGVDIVSNASPSGLQFAGNQLSLLPDTARGFAVDSVGAYAKIDTSRALAFSGGSAGGNMQVVADAANGINIDAAAGLQVKYNSAAAMSMASSGLQVVVDSTRAMAIDATAGLQVTLQANTASSGASYANLAFGASGGLDTLGIPALFTVAGVAVGSTVTAPNFDTLTNGSNADALHFHDQAVVSLPTGSIAIRSVVVVNSSGSLVAASRASNGRVSGLVVAQDQIACIGVVNGFSGLSAGTDYYLGASGALVAGVPSGAGYVVYVGTATSSTQLLLGSIPPGAYLN